jgi:hypothetical protein
MGISMKTLAMKAHVLMLQKQAELERSRRDRC